MVLWSRYLPFTFGKAVVTLYKRFKISTFKIILGRYPLDKNKSKDTFCRI